MKTRWLAIALLVSMPVLAQPPGGGGRENPAQRMEQLTTLLDLTDAQKPQVQAILEAEHAKVREQMEQARSSGQKPSFDQMKAMHEQLHQETIAKLTPVLSAEQLKKFEALSEAHGPGRGGPPPADSKPQ